jgi:hypothetical protein
MEMILVLLPTIVLLVAGVWVIERLRVKEGGERYQHDEYRVDEDTMGGNGGGNGHHRRGRRPRGRRGG